MSKITNVLKESTSAGIGAAIGVVAGLVIPGVGSLLGGLIGAGIGRAVEGVANYIFGVDNKTSTTADTQQAAPAAVVQNQPGMNTADMTAKLGGFGSKPSIAAQFAEVPVAAPTGITKQFNPLFAADKSAAPEQTMAPQAKSLFPTPRLTMNAASAA